MSTQNKCTVPISHEQKDPPDLQSYNLLSTQDKRIYLETIEIFSRASDAFTTEVLDLLIKYHDQGTHRPKRAVIKTIFNPVQKTIISK